MTTTPAVGWVTSGYGKRNPPVKPDGTYGTAFHAGVDIGGPKGAPVVAPEAGTVVYIARNTVRGLYVIVDHGTFRTLHQHLNSTDVFQGQWVREGQPLGVMGTTGGVARHLHTEVHDGTTPIDPVPWYAGRGVILGSPIRVAGVQVTQEDDMRLIRDASTGSIALIGEAYAGEFGGGDQVGLAAHAAIYGAWIDLPHDQYVTAVDRAKGRMTAARAAVDVTALAKAVAAQLGQATGITPEQVAAAVRAGIDGTVLRAGA